MLFVSPNRQPLAATIVTKISLQTDSEQRPHKVSFHVEKSDAPPIVEALGNRLRGRGVSLL